MKKILKIITIFSLLAILLALLVNPVLASVAINPDDYNVGLPSATSEHRALEMAGKVLGVIRNVGIIAAVIILSIIGLKYMVGSLDEKANYKENFRVYIIGCALLVACTTIPSIIYSIMK